MEIILRYHLNGDDALECHRVHAPSFQRNVVASILWSLALIGLGLVCLILPLGAALAWACLGFGTATLVIGSVYRVCHLRRWRHEWSQLEPIELTVRDSGLVAQERGTRTEVTWSRFVRFREAENHFLLYKSADLYAIVPKRAFSSVADIEAFRELATRGIART